MYIPYNVSQYVINNPQQFYALNISNDMGFIFIELTYQKLRFSPVFKP